MRIAIVGNSGSGKSTLARRLARARSLPTLELDAVVWEPGQIAVERARAAVLADLDAFLAGADRWVVEGCYGELIEYVLPKCTELMFLNPGLDRCRSNALRRPWEPHKYDSAAAQDSKLDLLLEWIDAYYTRTDAWSLACHRRVFDTYDGPKTEVTTSETDLRAVGAARLPHH
ncbi:MAG: shikimate kinase [Gemmatimonadaceae bacterium]